VTLRRGYIFASTVVLWVRVRPTQATRRLTRPEVIESVVRPELPTASVGSSQAPTAAVDYCAPLATRRPST